MTAQLPAAALRLRVGLLACAFALAGSCAGERDLPYLPIAFVPEGMEFSPHGSMLFVQATLAHHIAVYAVQGMRLVESPFVLQTGEGPASMALTSR